MSFRRYPDLPAELRSQIRQFVVDERRDHSQDWYLGTNGKFRFRGRGLPIALLACVNKEWQFDVERSLFCGLELRHCPRCLPREVSDLQYFESLVTGARRSFVRYIVLRVESHANCTSPMESISDHQGAAVHYAIDWLFRILKQWEMPEDRQAVLKINLMFEHPLRDVARAPFEYTDLSVVPLVGWLRVESHDFSIPLLLSSLIGIGNKLPNLTGLMIYVNTRLYHANECLELVENMSQIIPKLRQVDIQTGALDITEEIAGIQENLHGWNPENLGESLSRTLREISYGLQNITFINIVDAASFLAPFSSENYRPASFTGPTWPRLRTFCLNGTDTFERTSHVKKMEVGDRLGASAGRAIEFMPELERMEITTRVDPHVTEHDQITNHIVFTMERTSHKDNTGARSNHLVFEVYNYRPSSNVLKIWTDWLGRIQGRHLQVEYVRFD
ncbi:hypothetical protein VP1G_01912 [Cytospora mali]|uniref:DUF6546 domain-containing protein n=1 Tax=Cytospora mali TaxID=578113 RepID=A0A194USJ2_CYTMA|nr:hypothetical protein VP1G_01912 [Valsa mali var. pyri (nom. inval.)]